jgi:CPA2 family monovalent cation:H+ antiporter-2
MVEWSHPVFFIELLVILTGSLASVIFCRHLRIPDLVGYLLAGALIGPHGLGVVTDDANIHFFSELGVTFLLFELGLEFSLATLFGLRRSVFGLGSLQVLLTTVMLALLLGELGGYAPTPALVVAGALALSSTAIVVRELRIRRLIHGHPAQLAVGVLIFQDLAALLLLILVPALGGMAGPPLSEQLGWALGKSMTAGALLLGVARWVLPGLFREAARTQSDEVFVLTTLVIVLLSGWVTSALGLSMAFGAFIVGAMLGESEFRHQVDVDMRPFRGVLMGLFFAGIGMKLDFHLFVAEWETLAMGTLLLILCKFAAAGLAARLMGETAASAWPAGLFLAQAGEFGFALIALAVQVGLVAPEAAARIFLVALASMALTPLLIGRDFAAARTLAVRVLPRGRSFHYDLPADLADHVILAGYGRVGQMIARFLNANGVPFIALDLDIEQVKRGRAAGEPVIYGSCARIELLRHCRIDQARLAILTFRSVEEALRVVGQIRALGFRLPILVRTQHHGDCIGLVSAGADHVVPEMFEASLLITSEVLAMLGFEEADIVAQVAAERERHGRPAARSGVGADRR